MIHYHGLPITPDTSALAAVSGGHAFVSAAHPMQAALAMDACQSFAVDNGAFSYWKGGRTPDWPAYYEWVSGVRLAPNFDFAVIPDVIDGTEEDNDRLLAEWPFSPFVGAPVWHMHESLERLCRLAEKYPRICLGSSGAFSRVGSPAWWGRMHLAMACVCDRDGRPLVKLHGLRMLSVKVFPFLPLSSADSTNIARNVNLDQRWTASYAPQTKPGRAALMRERIEALNGAQVYSGVQP